MKESQTRAADTSPAAVEPLGYDLNIVVLPDGSYSYDLRLWRLGSALRVCRTGLT